MTSVTGQSNDSTPAVVGKNTAAGVGTWGESQGGEGVHGITHSPGAGVAGYNDNPSGGVGTWGESQHGEGVHGITHSPGAGVAGYNDNPSGGPGVWGESQHGPAGFFKGDVVVTGDVILSGADVAEDFEIVDSAEVEPGTVMVVDGIDRVRVSSVAYDRKVAGVVAGAGKYRSAILMDRRGHGSDRQPLAMVGKVLCKVDASFAPVEIGDLLTTSPTHGHAMKVTEVDQAVGAILGKAMASLADGRGLLPVLVALQ